MLFALSLNLNVCIYFVILDLLRIQSYSELSGLYMSIKQPVGIQSKGKNVKEPQSGCHTKLWAKLMFSELNSMIEAFLDLFYFSAGR